MPPCSKSHKELPPGFPISICNFFIKHKIIKKIFFPDIFLWRRSIYFTKKKSLPSWEGSIMPMIPFLQGLRAVKSNAMPIFQCFFTWACCVKYLINHHVLTVSYINVPGFLTPGTSSMEDNFSTDRVEGLVQAVMWAVGGRVGSCKWSVPRLPSATSCCVAWFLMGHEQILLCSPGSGTLVRQCLWHPGLPSDTPVFKYHFYYGSQVGKLVIQELLTNTKR